MTTVVLPHDPRWKLAFETEAEAIKRAFAEVPIQMHHIGSTAIVGILAKPIIDVLGVIPDLTLADRKTEHLEHLGYEAMGAYGIAGRRYFRKINGDGIRTHHLHIFRTGSPHIERHIAFRDFLRTHRSIAKDYSDLKARLTASGEQTWDAYLDGKAPFIRRVEREAVAWYRRSHL